MVKEIDYISIKELLSRVLRHPLLQEFTLEQAVQYTLDFIGIFGMPSLYKDKEEVIPICDFRGKLPCDLIEIEMVKDMKTDYPLRSMTGIFNPGGKYYHHLNHEPQFKTQGRVIITSFPKGAVRVAYKAIAVDDEGLPMLVDNPLFLKALELYVRCQMFGILFDLGKITQQVLNHTEQEYSWAAGQLEEEFKIPSMSEMESITNMLNQMIVRKDEFSKKFEALGNKEYNAVHNLPPIPLDEIHASTCCPPSPFDNKNLLQPCPVPPAKPTPYTESDIDRIINQPMI